VEGLGFWGGGLPVFCGAGDFWLGLGLGHGGLGVKRLPLRLGLRL
jgi:hypothetical protein